MKADTRFGVELALLALLALLWGSSYLFIKVALRDIPPFTLIAIRVTIAAIFLLVGNVDPEIQRALLAKVHEFWASIDANQPPPPNYSIDAETIIAMMRASTAGKFIDLSDDETFSTMARQYGALGKQAKALETERNALKAQLLERMTDAEAVAFDGGRISAKQIGEADIAYRRKGYRDFRVTVKAKTLD